jgi:NAD(P)H-dependent flavin oxidoreductase YrpB (nitropropane dioxygenase family)
MSGNTRWNNRVTKLLKCHYPIIEGSLGNCGTSGLAAAVSESGGFGIITAGALKTPDRFRQDIRQAMKMTRNPFGINLSRGLINNPEDMLQIAIEERVPVLETSAYRAEELGEKAHKAGMVWIHKVCTIKHAIAAEQQGADAVVIVGLEGAGFKNRDQLPTFITIPLAAQHIKIPIIAAGGIGEARGFLAALSMGAEGVYMGTAFMATKECPIPEIYKRSLVKADPYDRELRDRVLSPPDIEDFQKVMARKDAITRDKWLLELEEVFLNKSSSGKSKNASILEPSSLAVAFINKVVTVKELIDTIIKDAEKILERDNSTCG